MAVAGPELVVYLKAFAILLVLWRILTIGAFGQIFSGLLSAFLAFSLTRDNQFPKSIQDISKPLDDLKRHRPLKLLVSITIDILGTQYIPSPVLFKLAVGRSGFVPIGTFFVQYLYDRPILTGIDILKTQLPFANYIPTATIGWLIEQDIIREKWLGGPSGPFLRL